MKKPFFWEKAKKVLVSKDKKLGKIITNYPKDFLFSKSDPFYTLARSIVGQQISVKAAQAVWDRYESKVKNVTPHRTLKMHFMTLKACGLSRQKTLYLKSLAKAFINNEINPNKWSNYSDEEIISELIQIKGVGRWTAEMFLIFYLLRPNIFPSTDIGLLRAISINYNLKYPLKNSDIKKFKRKWIPWSTAATWYLWRSLDPVPVKY